MWYALSVHGKDKDIETYQMDDATMEDLIEEVTSNTVTLEDGEVVAISTRKGKTETYYFADKEARKQKVCELICELI
jgi:predicted Fe-Mo cluster-binding NifX family protein